MRSFILVIVAAFVLALGAMVYFWTQTSTHGRRGAKQTVAESTPLTLPKNDTGSPLRPGETVALKKYDQRTGELASEFIIYNYSPQRGGRIAVQNVTARFYIAGARTDKAAKDTHKVIQLHGVTGLFSSDSPRGKNSSNVNADIQAPSRGELHTVTLDILSPPDEDHPKEYSTLRLTMDNASFDSERSVIFTEQYRDRAAGVIVAADKVPVTIRGDDYDFDGRGLNLSWDQRDGRLKTLDVSHGERLVIKHPSNVMDSGEDTPKTHGEGNVAAKTPATKPLSLPGGAAIVASDVTPPAGQPARTGRGRRRPRGSDSATNVPRPKIEQSDEPPIYRAVFHENVRIVQNGQPLANADKMSVDFLMKNENDANKSTTQPATLPVTQPSDGVASATTVPSTPTTASSRRNPRGRRVVASTNPVADTLATGPTTGPSTHPSLASTNPNEQPIEIYWTGPLHVAPYGQVDLAEGESIVTLDGAPVVARQQNSEIRASRLVYRTSDASLQGSALPGTIVSLISSDSHGTSIIKTAALQYLAHSDPPMAILTGKSTADLPAQADGAKMKAAWNERCTLFFANLPDGKTAIETAALSGDVKIDHPQIKLDAQRLELAFDTGSRPTSRPATGPETAPATGPATGPATLPALVPAALAGTQPSTQPSPLMQTNLKRLVATTAVHCVMTDAQKNDQTIDCDRLTVITNVTEDGKLVPRTVTADGSVHAVDPDQDLRAGHLAVTLAPSTRPSGNPKAITTQPSTQPETVAGLGGNVDLQSLIAHDSVHVIGKKDGTEAFADTMLIDKKDGRPNVRLIGQPTAKVIDKSNIITGPIIEIAPDTQQLAIDGGGAMHGSQQETAGATTKPIDVTWTRSLHVDGKKNVVDALGDVIAKTVDADGSTSIARGDRAQLVLVDVPTTQTTTIPTTNPASTQLATSQPTSKPTGQEAMAKKTIRQAIFQDNAQVSSTTLNDDGTPLKRMNVFASLIQYDVIPIGEEMQKKVTIPVPGKMLVEDYRPPSTQPAGQQDNGAGARGATAFQWSKSLIYDDSEHKATMTGGVIIDHRDDVTKDDAMRLTGDQVVALLEPMPPTTQPATLPTTGSSTKPAATEPRYQVRRVTATGHILITMKTGELVADSVEYNPITHILIARGSDTMDAVFTRAVAGPGGTQPLRAQEMQWNALTDLPKITKPAGQFRK